MSREELIELRFDRGNDRRNDVGAPVRERRPPQRRRELAELRQGVAAQARRRERAVETLLDAAGAVACGNVPDGLGELVTERIDAFTAEGLRKHRAVGRENSPASGVEQRVPGVR